MRTLIAGGLFQSLAIAAFALLATQDPNPVLFATVMVVDNFSISFAGVALVAYMSSLTSLGYTATQYALLSSAYTWPGKVLKGTTGPFVKMPGETCGAYGSLSNLFPGLRTSWYSGHRPVHGAGSAATRSAAHDVVGMW